MYNKATVRDDARAALPSGAPQLGLRELSAEHANGIGAASTSDSPKWNLRDRIDFRLAIPSRRTNASIRVRSSCGLNRQLDHVATRVSSCRTYQPAGAAK